MDDVGILGLIRSAPRQGAKARQTFRRSTFDPRRRKSTNLRPNASQDPVASARILKARWSGSCPGGERRAPRCVARDRVSAARARCRSEHRRAAERPRCGCTAWVRAARLAIRQQSGRFRARGCLPGCTRCPQSNAGTREPQWWRNRPLPAGRPRRSTPRR